MFGIQPIPLWIRIYDSKILTGGSRRWYTHVSSFDLAPR